MSFDTGFNSQSWQSSKNSQNSSGLSDDDLDLDRPPTYTPHKLHKTKYSSKLFLTQKAQKQRGDGDSGFDFTSASSSGTLKSLSKFQSLETSQKAIPSQSTVSVSDSFGSSATETKSPLGGNPQNDSHMKDYEPMPPTNSQRIEYEEDADEEMSLSGAATAVEEEEHREQRINEMPIFIQSEIDKVVKLFTKIKTQHSDWACVYALASNMCKDIYPKNSYISFKTALLLSIVSCNVESNAQPISIMAITRDSAVASSIMRQIGNIARRFICINDDLKFNGKCSRTNTVAANSLLMARSGVCFIGDWLGLKPASLNYLQNVMDSGRVTADHTSNIEYALKCAVWMYWSCSAKKMSQNQKDLNSISKLFGIPVVLDEVPGQDVIDFLFAQCATNQSDMHMDEGDEIDENTIKTYLNFVSAIPTQFDAEALSMLKFYFIVTRSIRPNILTPKSFDILQRLSECHAKLCLRTEVLKIDVMYAIKLFEEFVLSVFAGQVMTKPMPNLSPNSYEQADDKFCEFDEWLRDYVSKINENIHIFFQENL